MFEHFKSPVEKFILEELYKAGRKWFAIKNFFHLTMEIGFIDVLVVLNTHPYTNFVGW